MGWFSRRHADEPEDPQAVIDRLAGTVAPPSATGDFSLPASPAPTPAGDFAMPVGDVFTITGRGTVATGRIGSGSVAVGDRLAVVRDGVVVAVTKVTGVEMFRKKLDRAGAGENVGLLLDAITKNQIATGDLLVPAQPGT